MYSFDSISSHYSVLLSFLGNSEETVRGVLDGRWDVGFVRTGLLERTVDPATGDIVDSDLVKVLDPQFHVLDDGELFPFLHSTAVFPEWPLSAKKNVDRIVSEEVAKAVINMGYHAHVGEAIHECMQEAVTAGERDICETMPPVYFDPNARCDTTRELAGLAFTAGIAGFHKGFRTPRSHYYVRSMQHEANFIVKDEDGKFEDNIICNGFPPTLHIFLILLFTPVIRHVALRKSIHIVRRNHLSRRSLQGSRRKL